MGIPEKRSTGNPQPIYEIPQPAAASEHFTAKCFFRPTQLPNGRGSEMTGLQNRNR
jgi:hypothetical protein